MNDFENHNSGVPNKQYNTPTKIGKETFPICWKIKQQQSVVCLFCCLFSWPASRSYHRLLYSYGTNTNNWYRNSFYPGKTLMYSAKHMFWKGSLIFAYFYFYLECSIIVDTPEKRFKKSFIIAIAKSKFNFLLDLDIGGNRFRQTAFEALSASSVPQRGRNSHAAWSCTVPSAGQGAPLEAGGLANFLTRGNPPG